MLGGGREHIEDAAADRELAALAHHVDPGVGQLDQSRDEFLERDLGTSTPRTTGSTLATSGVIGCSSERAVVTTTRRGGPSLASSGCVSRRSSISRAPTVSTPGDSRSCGRVSQDGNSATAVTEHPTQFGGQVVGLPPGGGDHQQRLGLGERGGDEQPRAGGPDHRHLVGSALGPLDQIGECRGGQRQLDETRDRGLDRGVPRCGHDAPDSSAMALADCCAR